MINAPRGVKWLTPCCRSNSVPPICCGSKPLTFGASPASCILNDITGRMALSRCKAEGLEKDHQRVISSLAKQLPDGAA